MTCVTGCCAFNTAFPMRTITRTLTVVTLTLLSGATFAQPGQESWLVETMYKSGKINSVMAVVAVLIAGLAAWMFVMDRKVRRMEKEQQQRN
jgi:cytochrome bd-type quinol oxidase subunit 2